MLPERLLTRLGTALLCAALAACSGFAPCGSEDCRADTGITAEVQKQFAARPAFGVESIGIRTIDHVVYLNGLVDTDLVSREAEAVARAIPNVTDVVNNLGVTGNHY